MKGEKLGGQFRVPRVLLSTYIDLDYCDIEWFALKTNRDYSVIFEIA